MSKFRPNSVPKKIVPYSDFEQVILVFRPEWVVQSQHMERFFSGANLDEIWTWPLKDLTCSKVSIWNNFLNNYEVNFEQALDLEFTLHCKIEQRNFGESDTNFGKGP